MWKDPCSLHRALILKPGSFLPFSSISGGGSDRSGPCGRVNLVSTVDAMRLRLAGAVLLSAAAYYVYLPLPSGVSEPWKLMLLDALFRSFMQAVRADWWLTGGQKRAGWCEERQGCQDHNTWSTKPCRWTGDMKIRVYFIADPS